MNLFFHIQFLNYMLFPQRGLWSLLVLAKVAFSFPVYHITLSFLFFVFFWCGPFLNGPHHWIHYNIASVLCLVFWLWGLWNFSFPVGDWTCTRRIGRRSLHHWTTREDPPIFFLILAWCLALPYILVLFIIYNPPMAHTVLEDRTLCHSQKDSSA